MRIIARSSPSTRRASSSRRLASPRACCAARTGAFFDALVSGPQSSWLFGDPVDGRLSLFEIRGLGRSVVSRAQYLPLARAGEGAFAASSSCAAVADDGAVLLVTTGTSYPPRLLRFDPARLATRETLLPLAADAPSRGAFSVATRGDVVVVVGGDYREPGSSVGCAAFSRDGGVSFTPARGVSGFRSAVDAPPGYPGCFVTMGPEGAEVSIDDGQTWTLIPELRGHALRFAPGGIGFASGPGGRV